MIALIFPFRWRIAKKHASKGFRIKFCSLVSMNMNKGNTTKTYGGYLSITIKLGYSQELERVFYQLEEQQ